MAQKFYKFSLVSLINELDFNKKGKEIWESIKQYNKIYEGKKVLHLLNIKNDVLDVVIELYEDKFKMVDLRTLRKFVILLNNGIRGPRPNNSSLLKCLEVQELSLEEFKALKFISNYNFNLLNEINDTLKISKFDKQFNNEGEYAKQKNIEVDLRHKIDNGESNSQAINGWHKLIKVIDRIEMFIDNMSQKLNKELHDSCPQYLFNCLITGPIGTGKLKIAKSIYKKLLFSGVIKKDNFLVLDYEQVQNFNGIEKILEQNKNGVVYIRSLDKLTKFIPPNKEYKPLQKLISDIAKYRNQFIFILSGEKPGMQKLIEISNLDQHIKFDIDMPQYSNDELFVIGKELVKTEGYEIEDSAYEAFNERLNIERQIENFENINTIKKIIELAIVNKNSRRIAADNVAQTLIKEDFSEINNLLTKNATINQNTEDTEKDPFVELDEMIGLEEVKEKIKNIACYLEIQKMRRKLGIKSEPICLHLEMTGNPGTGKTTVARILGRIFKKLGLLETGNFIEVGREDLVGQFVGHTGRKTSEVIDKAMGGVLFIDEAYALYSESGKDYGAEALTTLIKKMEDHRDKFAVILAGYPNEMNLLRHMNPGLADRIQYRIHFPDYKPEELIMIFHKFCLDNEYVIGDGVENIIFEVFRRIYDNKGRNFSNGRLIRKCFDRIKVFQSKRVVKEGNFTKEAIMTITAEDVRRLYYDQNISQMLDRGKKKVIGFIS